MPKFTISISREVEQIADVIVDAPTLEDAIKIAESKSVSDAADVAWQTDHEFRFATAFRVVDDAGVSFIKTMSWPTQWVPDRKP
jgi:hypothetical protein